MTEASTKPSFFDALKSDPATQALLGSVRDYATAKASSTVTGLGDRVSSPRNSDSDDGSDEGSTEGATTAKAGAVQEVAQKVADNQGEMNPMQMIGAGLKGAVKGTFRRKKGSGGNKRPTNITDEFWIGLPVGVVYDEWTNYERFPSYMKGPTRVSKGDDDGLEVSWQAKIFLSTRGWKSKTVEQVPNERIRWSTEGPKGTVDGCITFHEVADRLTLMIFVLEYRPKGFMEWWGNRWRTVGRRYRLDVKHFRRDLMMRGEVADEERGLHSTITDGEVTESNEDARAAEGQPDEEGEPSEQESDDQGEPDQGEPEPEPESGKEPAEQPTEEPTESEDQPKEEHSE